MFHAFHVAFKARDVIYGRPPNVVKLPILYFKQGMIGNGLEAYLMSI